MSTERSAWEYADGPEVGREIPITNEPRREHAPGVPARQSPPGPEHDAGDLEERQVRVADPNLDADTNRRLTEEVRDAVGADRVRVPRDRPRPSHGERPASRGLSAALASNRLTVIVTFAVFFTIGAIVSLATGSWWLLPLALGVHALGTITVVTRALQLTTVSEHPSPSVAAALEEEGIPNSDEHFSALVEEFSADGHAELSDVVSPGANQRTAAAAEDPSTAAAEQSSAMTPTAGASEPAGEEGIPALMIWSTVFALLAVSLIVPLTSGGGAMWLLPAIMVPLLAGWVVIDRRMAATHKPGGQQSDEAQQRN
ncbi:MAG: hypothetical protein M3018_09300 [Actinomycetota bacterium]|nr:hypothetical protein [Actinomycetota bacterium]